MSVLLVLVLLSSAFAAVPLSSVQRTTTSTVVPKRYIVEIDDVSNLHPAKRDVHQSFYSSLTKRVGNFKVDREYNTTNIFVGAAISISGSETLAQISQIPGVKTIRPVHMVSLPKPVTQVIPNGPKDAAVPPDSESTHVMTGVDKLHAKHLFGKGTQIGIIDTGTDYMHPSLGRGFGPGHKVAGGYDFVGDAFNGTNTPMPDPDPLDQCNGHGTHVAGIIGADPNNSFNISGVAFEATIFSYRIFGCQGATTDDLIIEALLRGASDGMDILTLSLGGSDGWTESISSVVASRIADEGTIVTISGGNDGAFGAWFTSAPSNGLSVISVASVENTVIHVQNATTSDPTHPNFPYVTLSPLPVNDSLQIFATSKDTTVVNDACDPLPANTPDLSRSLVIVRRGTCPLTVKLNNIADKGAKIALIYNNVDGLFSVFSDNFTAAGISAVDGHFLVSQFAAGTSLTVAFPQNEGQIVVSQPNGGLVSTFSSYGPSYDLLLKPAVAAPGGNVLSTFPTMLGSFAVLSGTSMAAPFVAGSAAILLQVKGKSADVARGARTLFETTAQLIPSTKNDSDPLQTLTQQGSGLIDVYNAIYSSTTVSPGELLLNDSAHFSGSHTITIQNTGPEPQRYKLSHVPAGTAITIQPDTMFASTGPVPLTTNYANVYLSSDIIDVQPHGKANVEVSITPPTNVDSKAFPVYTGFIQVQSVDTGDMLHVAYQGVAAAMKDMTVIDNTNTFGPNVTLPTLLDASGNPQVKPTNYTFEGEDFPTLLYRLAAGTPKLLIDLVKPDLILSKRDLGTRGIQSYRDGGVGAIPVVGALAELDFQPRNSDDPANGGLSTIAFSNRTFVNNSFIPDGKYKILMRALKITGDPTKEEDFESFLSPVVGFTA